jgi:biopolymer transport protein ExbD/biopolymer transport protein TolR
MRRRSARIQLNAEINVVSLIDVMMLLLVIFMITAPMMQGGVDVQLPTAEARPLEPKSGIVVTIDRLGNIAVDGTKMTYDEFRAAFRALSEQRARQGVYVQADERANYGMFVRVVAVLRNAGVEKLAIVAEPEQTK